jgi:acyl-CoA thioesterase FadM
MNLYLRLLYTLIISYLQPKVGINDEQSLHFRTWPHDLDLNLHMNNGRYLTLMDLGRMQLLIRLGVMGTVMKNRWMPVIGGAEIRFRRSLAPFQSFELKTRLISWDEKWVYIEQKFVSRGEIVAIAHIKGLIKGKKGPVPTHILLAHMGHSEAPLHPIPKAFL